MPLLCIPGLGGDRRIFDPILKHLAPDIRARIRFVDLSPARLHESLGDYSNRILRDQGFQNAKFSHVVGISFGGMIAQEALRSGGIQAKQALLISTALSGSDLTMLSRICASCLPLIPDFMHGAIVWFLAAVYPWVRFRMTEAGTFANMLRAQDPGLLFRVPAMIAQWNPEFPGKLPCAFVHVQGTRDPLISYNRLKRTRSVDVPVAGGNHLVFVSEARLIASLF
ncbi:MAG: alpha/beta hydrolase [Spirochaetia bacterium]|nr:alpha/beta hydrolase [Spirochaetia bacterium]